MKTQWDIDMVLSLREVKQKHPELASMSDNDRIYITANNLWELERQWVDLILYLKLSFSDL